MYSTQNSLCGCDIETICTTVVDCLACDFRAIFGCCLSVYINVLRCAIGAFVHPLMTKAVAVEWLVLMR